MNAPIYPCAFTTLDEENWSFWSAPYVLTAGQRDSTVEVTEWRDGTPILSPGPERYLQIQVIFLSSLHQAGALRELEIQFAPPAALEVVGEIWPQDVSRSESTTFTYSDAQPLLQATRALIGWKFSR